MRILILFQLEQCVQKRVSFDRTLLSNAEFSWADTERYIQLPPFFQRAESLISIQ
jgi:hypothetical protein